MDAFEQVLIDALGAVALVWFGLSCFVLIDRALYDLRGRSVDAAHELLDPRLLRSAPGPEREAEFAAILSSLPRRTIERVAADASAPRWIAEAFAAQAVSGDGARRLVRRAASHRTELGRWRRVAALRILARAGHGTALSLLRHALSEGDRELASAAVAILGAIEDERAAQALIDALRAGAYAPSRIATHLNHFPLPIDHLLRPLLGDPSPVVRFWGANLLARYGRRAGVADQLAALAGDPDPNVRAAVAESLGKARLSKARDEAVRRLIDDPVWYVRAHAARSAGRLGLVADADRIAPLLADRQWWVRAAAKHAFEAFGIEAAETLVAHLDHPDAFARNGAAEVLQNIGFVERLVTEVGGADRPGPSLALLVKILDAGGPRLREAALARAEPEARSRLERLLEGARPAAEAA